MGTSAFLLGIFGVAVCGGAAGGAIAVATDPVREGCVGIIGGEGC